MPPRGARDPAVPPGFKERIVGLAVDIGSTTIAGHLCDLATGEVVASPGAMNPQIRFGEDLMSRVSYIMMNPGGDREMTAVVRDAVTMIAGQTVREAGLEASDILEVVVVGNPVMHHPFLGLDPVELGGAPFALALDTAYRAARTGSRSRGSCGCAGLCPCLALPAMWGRIRRA